MARFFSSKLPVSSFKKVYLNVKWKLRWKVLSHISSTWNDLSSHSSIISFLSFLRKFSVHWSTRLTVLSELNRVPRLHMFLPPTLLFHFFILTCKLLGLSWVEAANHITFTVFLISCEKKKISRWRWDYSSNFCTWSPE